MPPCFFLRSSAIHPLISQKFLQESFKTGRTGPLIVSSTAIAPRTSLAKHRSIAAPTMSTMSTATPLLTLTYFEFRGRVEPSRLTCVIGGIPFSNAVVPSEEFADRKKDLPLQQLPLLFVDQEGKERVIVGQSDAILRYVGKLAGLYPTDPVEAMKVDHWMDVIGDWTKYVMLTYGGAKSNFISDTEWTEAERMAVGQRAIDTALPKYLGAIDKEIAANGGDFVMGDTLTIVDMKLMHWIPWIQSGGLPAFPPSCLDAYPHVLALVDTISSMPVVKAFYERHPVPYEDFEYVPPADTIDDRWVEEGPTDNDEKEDVLALVDRISALPAAKAFQKTNPYDDIDSGITTEDNWQLEEGVTEDNDEEDEEAKKAVMEKTSSVREMV